MSDRPKRLFYAGDGRSGFHGVPRRDLAEADIARLSDARLAEIAAKGPGGKALYQRTAPADRAKAEPPPGGTREKPAAASEPAAE